MSERNYTIKMKYIVYASPDKVFEALTDGAVMKKWGGNGKVSEKEDGDVEMFDGWIKGKTLIYKPGKKLAYTWKPSEWEKKAPASEVQYTLNAHKAGTEILLEQKGFPSDEEMVKHKDGWIDYVFEPLNDYFTSLIAP